VEEGVRKSPSEEPAKGLGSVTIGMELGDKTSRYGVLDNHTGAQIKEGSVPTSQKGMRQTFGALPLCRSALEVGTHSPWVSRLLNRLGHEVRVAHARQVKLISASSRKDDRLDAQMLAIRARAALVETRTSLVNTARGLVKALGERLPPCDADQMALKRHRFAAMNERTNESAAI
jgi:transposase